jgi:aarF domain-containing kinase
LFPKEYVLEFQKCLDSTEPLDWKVVKAIIEKETGPINNNFAFIDETPLASASIAQVHAAKLKTGEEVVIKVQKPQIDNLLKADLNFIYIASRVLEFLQPDFERTSLSAVAGDVKSSMLEELDFEKEAENIEEFRDFLRDQGLRDSVTAPRVYRDQTTKKVLTMERLRGVSMVDAESIRTITNDPESLIITALNTWTTSVMNMRKCGRLCRLGLQFLLSVVAHQNIDLFCTMNFSLVPRRCSLRQPLSAG